MNKYKSALSDILCFVPFGKVDEQEKMLQKLVDKEIPKKVLKRETNGETIKVGNVFFKTITMWYCPSCKEWISPSTSVNYCGHCGQKLDYWGKNDE